MRCCGGWLVADGERALCFGPGERLIGILDHRVGDAPVACLLINTGVTQHIGPRRLNVKLARALAAQGISSLRMDLSGLGDSGAATTENRYQDQASADLRAAMDVLQAETGHTRFVVLGICSGAVNAWRTAQADERVAGFLMFDGYTFPTLGTKIVYHWRHACARGFVPVLAGLARGVWGRLARTRRQTAAAGIFGATRDSAAPTREQFADSLDALTARGVAVLLVYSGTLLGQHNHESQLRHAFRGRPFLQRVDYRFMPEVDHMPTSQHAQRRFLDLVVGWAAVTCTRSGALADRATGSAQT